MNKIIKFNTILFLIIFISLKQIYSFDIVLLKYKMGDYYNARDGIKNFINEIKKRTIIDINTNLFELSLEDNSIFQHSFLILNGHVPVKLSEKEKINLRRFILNGGFLFANDDYGMDESFRKLMEEVFPDYKLVEIDFNNEIYHIFYEFKNGIPKIHEHYEGPPKAYGIFIDGKISVFYAYNSDIIDGWDPPEIHNDPPEKREEAFRMGINIVLYYLTK